jgi:hypothetical protein
MPIVHDKLPQLQSYMLRCWEMRSQCANRPARSARILFMGAKTFSTVSLLTSYDVRDRMMSERQLCSHYPRHSQ